MILFHYMFTFSLWDYDIFIISSITFSTQIFHVIFYLFIVCPSHAFKKELKKIPLTILVWCVVLLYF